LSPITGEEKGENRTVIWMSEHAQLLTLADKNFKEAIAY
jgi:hypothetical protein